MNRTCFISNTVFLKKMNFLTFSLFLIISSICSEPYGKSAIRIMKVQFGSILMYAKLKDYTCIKSLVESYPKTLDTEYKWLDALPILADMEFEILDAHYVFPSPHILPEDIVGKVNYTLMNETFKEVGIMLKKNTWVSVTEWRIQNPIFEVLQKI